MVVEGQEHHADGQRAPRQGRDLGGLVITLSEDRDARAQAHSFGHDEQEHER